MLYRTYFKLTNPVIDFDAAYDYLTDDNMKNYMEHDDRIENFYDKIEAITWILTDEQSGHIDLETNEPLSDNELKNVSDWVSGQNSDGLGEGFEQQDFASYNDSYDDDEYDEFWVMASFDWETNDYIFEKIN